eukprot:jgi/Botrbrau1/13750/Bobra.0056s0007.1
MELEAEVAGKAEEIHNLQNAAIGYRQQISSLKLELQEAAERTRIAEAAVRKATDYAANCGDALSQRLGEEHRREIAEIHKQLDEAHVMASKAQDKAREQAQLAEAAERECHRLEGEVAALGNRPEEQEFVQARQAASEAQDRAKALEEEVRALQEETNRLAAELQKAESKASTLQADAETRGAALKSLQVSLARIEKSVERPPGSANPGRGGYALRRRILQDACM